MTHGDEYRLWPEFRYVLSTPIEAAQTPRHWNKCIDDSGEDFDSTLVLEGGEHVLAMSVSKCSEDIV